MAATYTPIATVTVTGSNLLGTTGVTFSSIPSTYTDVILVQSVAATAPAIACIQVNGDTGTTYSQTSLSGNGSAASSSRTSSTTLWRSDIAHLNTAWSNYISQFQNYSNTTTYKTCLQRYNDTAFGTEAIVGLWRSTSAINSIKVFMDRAEYYVVGSTFTLYGIQAA